MLPPGDDSSSGALRRSTRQGIRQAVKPLETTAVCSAPGKSAAVKSPAKEQCDLRRGKQPGGLKRTSAAKSVSVVVKKSVGRPSKSVRFEGIPARGTAQPCSKRKQVLPKPSPDNLACKKPRSMSSQGRNVLALKPVENGGADLNHEDPVDPEDEAAKRLGNVTKMMEDLQARTTLKGSGVKANATSWVFEAFARNPDNAEAHEGSGEASERTSVSEQNKGNDGNVKNKEVEIQHLLVQEEFSSFDLYEGLKNLYLGWFGKLDTYYNAFHKCKAGRIIVCYLKEQKLAHNHWGSTTISGYIGDMKEYLRLKGEPYSYKELAELYWNEAEAASLPRAEGQCFHHSLMNEVPDVSEDSEEDF